MAYKLKPNYHFSNGSQLGINKVPIGRLIIVESYGNSNEILWFKKVSNNIFDSSGNIIGLLSDSSTIIDAVNGFSLINPLSVIVDTYTKTEIESMTSLYRTIADSFSVQDSYNTFRAITDSYSLEELDLILTNIKNNESGIIQYKKMISNDYTILEGYDAISYGPIIVDNVTITISDNSVWKII